MSPSSSLRKQLPGANSARGLPTIIAPKGPFQSQVVSIAPPAPTLSKEESDGSVTYGMTKAEQTVKSEVGYIQFSNSGTCPIGS